MRGLVALLTAAVVSACAPPGTGGQPAESPAGHASPASPAAESLDAGPREAHDGPSTATNTSAPVLVAAAGDIACDPEDPAFADEQGTDERCRQEDTAELLDRGSYAAVLALGDLQYRDGTLEQFRASYDRSWGRHRAVTRPVPGNHEYRDDDAAGYFAYWGEAAGDPERGYYAFELGTWRVLALNSTCEAVGGCGAGSPQEQWVRAQLAASDATCQLAFMHHPRFSSAKHGSDASVAALFAALYDGGVEVLLAGHDHVYERFAPQDPQGHPDPAGVRQFTVGTGGSRHYEFRGPLPTSEARHSGTFGVLELALAEDGYAWRFLPVDGEEPLDAGSGSCH